MQKIWSDRQTFDPQHIRDMSDAIIEVIDEFDGDTELTKDYAEAMVADLIGAGMDTVSTALHWIVLLPAKHPDIQTKLHELTDWVVGRGRLPSDEDRVHMPYLDAFIYETMRFTSFVTVTIPHSKTSDVTWSVNHDPLRKWIADQFEIFLFFAILLHQCKKTLTNLACCKEQIQLEGNNVGKNSN
uniref:Uncharacterized protein n=1 Tax=Poecilia mexicana TaxID=48701 RepID=A0A3B3WUV6_9TELE